MLTLLSSVLPVADMRLHCAAPASAGATAGAIIGLTSDNTYNVRLPQDAPAGNVEKWTRVDHDAPPATMAAVPGSFTGSYMQVLPDDRNSYYDIHGEGSFTMTGLEYVIDVAAAGKHTLYLRWSAGDDKGAGDSLYVVMREYATDHIVAGEDTLKPTLVAIDAVPGQFAGCCYDHSTHACTCFAADQTNETGCDYWVPTERAKGWAQCEKGAGEMDAVTDPKWYLYSGKEDPTAVTFAAEPWDATCEAAGTGTKDTGKDFATWNLPVGRYRFVIYPREDGTAVDAFYLAGPGAAPPNGLVLSAGASTTAGCSSDRLSKEPDGMGRGATHGADDAAHWSHWGSGPKNDQGKDAGFGCGHCLEAIPHSECPSADTLAAMITCDTVELGELCEADGECNTDVHINNCEQPSPPPAATGSNGPRTHMNRDNDVYKRVPCPMPAPPPAPKPPPPLPFLPGGVSGGLTSNDSNGSSDSPAGIIVLVLFLVLAAAAAAVVVYKGWAKPIARSVAMWVRGDTDASAYIRNRDSARAGSTAPVQAAGSFGGLAEPTMTRMPAGASTYNPPA